MEFDGVTIFSVILCSSVTGVDDGVMSGGGILNVGAWVGAVIAVGVVGAGVVGTRMVSCGGGGGGGGAEGGRYVLVKSSVGG